MTPLTPAPEPAADRAAGRRLLLRTLWEQRAGLALGALAGVLGALAKVSVPLWVKHAIDDGIASGLPRAAWGWALWIAAAGVLCAAGTGGRRYFAIREGHRCERRLRRRLFEHVLGLHFGYHDRAQTGQLMSRAHTDLAQLHNLFSTVPITLANAAIVAAASAILVRLDPLLALMALGSLPFVQVLGRRFSQRLHPAVRGLQEEAAQLASVVEESVAGVRVIKGFGAERVQRQRLVAEADDVFDMAMAAARVRSAFLPALELVPNLGLVLVLAYGGQRVLAGELSIGTLIMFNFYVVLLVNPLRQLGQIIAQTQRALAACERVAAVLSIQPEIAASAAPAALPPQGGGAPRGEVRFEGVRFAYASAPQRPVLEKLELVLRAGESVALVGATGSGKSTLAKLIPRFYDVQHGALLLDGIDVRELPLAQLRAAVGIVFEDSFLFSDSLAANIAFARPAAERAQIERAARLAGAHDFITELPAGYETPVGERGFALSGGQRQRIAIARAILCDPRVLILDDATSSVDPEKEQEIRSSLAQVMRGRTTLVIAHRPATVALADRVLLIEEGCIAAEGSHEQLLRTHARYREVLAAGEGAPRSAAQ